jgi:hypothetical protein
MNYGSGFGTSLFEMKSLLLFIIKSFACQCSRAIFNTLLVQATLNSPFVVCHIECLEPMVFLLIHHISGHIIFF